MLLHHVLFLGHFLPFSKYKLHSFLSIVIFDVMIDSHDGAASASSCLNLLHNSLSLILQSYYTYTTRHKAQPPQYFMHFMLLLSWFSFHNRYWDLILLALYRGFRLFWYFYHLMFIMPRIYRISPLVLRLLKIMARPVTSWWHHERTSKCFSSF